MTINGCSAEKGRIHIHWREWEGVGRPEYIRSHGEGLHPNLARAFGQQLIDAADLAEAWTNDAELKALDEMLIQKQRLDNQIEALHNKLKNKGA